MNTMAMDIIMDMDMDMELNMGMNIDIFTYMNMGVKKGTVTYQGTDLGSGHE
jgi:hypothetical protein